ncbi:unnamed protein product [Notodromas monacha]|uniref:Uncharacterized protein n=1 Tax=Notodromas monacha TaxID=399045 RepID=A0A7R9BZD7_9CRUS|nr:unnamed protein product [Notodromas monacha]CAG0923371.1 unnamed protein product [Notodromas monacha]
MLEQPKYDFDISRKSRGSGFNFRSGTIAVGIINMEEKKLLRPWLAWVALNCVFGLGCLVALIACARRALIANNDVGLMWTQIFLVLIEGLMFPVVYAYHKTLQRSGTLRPGITLLDLIGDDED